jgi:hypothetical protein
MVNVGQGGTCDGYERIVCVSEGYWKFRGCSIKTFAIYRENIWGQMDLGTTAVAVVQTLQISQHYYPTHNTTRRIGQVDDTSRHPTAPMSLKQSAKRLVSSSFCAFVAKLGTDA